MRAMDPVREVETARLLLEAARYLGETLDPYRVYERFREIMAEAIPHDGVVVSSFDPGEGVIRCDYAWSTVSSSTRRSSRRCG